MTILARLAPPVAAAVVFSLLAPAAFAYGGHRGPPGGHGHHGPMDLGLSDAQKAKMRALHDKHRVQTAPLRAKLDMVRAKLKALWIAKRINKAAITATEREHRALRGKMGQMRLQMRFAVAGILTYAQRVKWADKMGRRHHGPPARGMHGQRGQRGPQGGPAMRGGPGGPGHRGGPGGPDPRGGPGGPGR